MLMLLWCLFTWSSNPLGEQAAASVRQQPRFSSRQPHEVSGFFTNSADTGLAKPEVSQMSDSGSDSAPSRAPWSSQGIFPRRGNAAFLRPEFLLLCSLDPEQAVKSNQSALCLFKSNRSYAVWDFLAKWIFFFPAYYNSEFLISPCSAAKNIVLTWSKCSQPQWWSI